MKKLLGIMVLGLLWCNISFAEIKHKKVECQDEIFIDFIEDDKKAVLYRFFPEKFSYYKGEFEILEELTYIYFTRKSSKYEIPSYRLNRETGKLAIYASGRVKIIMLMICEPLGLLDAVTEGKADFEKYLDERVDNLKKKQKEKNKF